MGAELSHRESAADVCLVVRELLHALVDVSSVGLSVFAFRAHLLHCDALMP